MDLIISSKKELEFCWHHLYAMTEKTINQQPPKKVDKMAMALLKAHLANIFPTYEEGLENIEKIKYWFNQSSLSDNELAWLKQNNSRLTHWLWNLLVCHKNLSNLINHLNPIEIEINSPSNQDFFDIFSFNRNAYSTKEKHELLIKAFDLSIMLREDKIKLLNQLRERWEQMKSEEEFTWIDGNNTAVSIWAVDYFKDYCNKNFLPINAVNYISFEHPLNEFILLFDSWSIDSANKKLFIIAMKKALSQKKYRDKQAGKKQCSFNLSENTILQLSELSTRQGRPKNHILETLIYAEYFKEANKI